MTTTTYRLISLITGNPLFPAIQFAGKRTTFHSSSSLCFYRRSFSSSAAVIDAADHRHHPWPEWVSFVDRLSSKGYLAKEDDEGNDVVSGDVYKDMNLLKDACLGFARDRFDIFKSLARQDIQTVVEKGCPNTLRKAVNSGKRLRLYVQLDEADVCSGCNLRGSCDRANVILKEAEGTARTADIVRILLFYALDPLLITGGQMPPGRELIESSARKLLSELVALSETPLDPGQLESIAVALKTKKKFSGFTHEETSFKDVGVRDGDWRCPKCNYLNFSRNVICRECKDKAPRKFGGVDVEMKKGDWICPDCNFMNFSRNIKCLKCSTKGPTRVGVEDVEMKKGDWNCTQCGFMNFASNVKCLRCREQRPKRELNPGEWECPSCDFLNYRKNVICRKCNVDRPKAHVEPQYEDQIWSRPSRQ